MANWQVNDANHSYIYVMMLILIVRAQWEPIWVLNVHFTCVLDTGIVKYGSSASTPKMGEGCCWLISERLYCIV